MTVQKTAQSTKARSKAKARPKATKKPVDPTAAFAEQFFAVWQKQWQEMLNQKAMPGAEALGLPPGFIPLQNIGPMGLMAPMGAVAMANLKMLQDLQARVKELEAALKKSAKK